MNAIAKEQGSVADPDPGSGSGMKNLDHISESLENFLGSGMEKIRIRKV
jgi:hypothetical protein